VTIESALKEHFDLPPRGLLAKHPGGNTPGIVKHEEITSAKQARQGRHLAMLQGRDASGEVE
jgi:hypothetical protein